MPNVLRGWIARLLLAACVIVPIGAVAAYVLNPAGAQSRDPRERILGIGLYRIPSESMAPALVPGRILLVRVGRAAVADVGHGDIVTFTPPHQPGQTWIKRLVALPGEMVEIREGVLHVDGRVVHEPYVDPARRRMEYSRAFGPHRVAAGHVFLLGDNRDNSEDGRFWGDAPLDSLHGRLSR